MNFGGCCTSPMMDFGTWMARVNLRAKSAYRNFNLPLAVWYLKMLLIWCFGRKKLTTHFMRIRWVDFWVFLFVFLCCLLVRHLKGIYNQVCNRMATFKLYCVLVFHHVCLKASTLGRWQNDSHAKTQSYVNSFTWRRVDIQRLCQRPTIVQEHEKPSAMRPKSTSEKRVVENNMSNEQKTWLFRVHRDYTTPLCWDYNKPLQGSLLNNQYNEMAHCGLIAAMVRYAEQFPPIVNPSNAGVFGRESPQNALDSGIPTIARWWFQICVHFHLYLWKIPIVTSIFFNWFETKQPLLQNWPGQFFPRYGIYIYIYVIIYIYTYTWPHFQRFV